MFETLLLLGLVCVIAAVVGGGLTVANIKVPVVSRARRQVLLAAVGGAIIAVAFLGPRPPPDPTPVKRAALPSACAAELKKSGAGAGGQQSPIKSLGRISVHPRPSAIAVVRTSVWVAHEDGMVTRIPPRTRRGDVRPLRGVQLGHSTHRRLSRPSWRFVTAVPV